MLFLQKIVYHLPTIPTVGTITDMHPIGAFRIVLPDELIELAVALDPLKPPLALLYVAVDAEVCRLAIHVLTVSHTANGIVQGQRTIAAAYLDGIPHRLPERLQHLMHQGTEINHIRLSWLVADSLRLGRRTGTKLLERKILTNTYHIV